eukprot:284595_1
MSFFVVFPYFLVLFTDICDSNIVVHVPLGTPVVDNFNGWFSDNLGIINGAVYPKYHGVYDDYYSGTSSWIYQPVNVEEYGYLRISYTIIFGCDITEYTDDLDMLWGNDYFKTYYFVNA